MSEIPELQIKVLPPEMQPSNQAAKAAHRIRSKGVTDSVTDEPELHEPEDTSGDAAFIPPSEPKERLIDKPDKVENDQGKAKTGPPTAAEWQDFLGRTVLRFMTDAYLTLALRDIEHLLTDREREQIRLSKEDLKELAAPMAELANKSPFMRKRGRMLVASADSVESVWTLVFWMRRVQRIAKRHRIELARQAKMSRPRVINPEDVINQNGNLRENPGQGNPGTAGGEYGPPLFNPGTG